MSATVVFLGPSLPERHARAVLPMAEYRPPIGRGDLQGAVDDGAHVVVIIDGVFHQRFPVTPTEIKQALQKNVTIFGAASMGALRAAEMYPLGMIGVGQVFEWYRTGQVFGEHEVAVIFDPETGVPLTVPLVNMRYAFSRAVNDGVVTEAVADLLLDCAKSLHYTELTYRAVVAKAGDEAVVPSGFTTETFRRYLETFDLKRDDAVACLRTVVAGEFPI